MVGCYGRLQWKCAGASPRKKTRKSFAAGGEPWPIRCTDRASLAAGGEIVNGLLQHPRTGGNVVTKRRGGFAQAPSMKQGPQDPSVPGSHHTPLHAPAVDHSTWRGARGEASGTGPGGWCSWSLAGFGTRVAFQGPQFAGPSRMGRSSRPAVPERRRAPRRQRTRRGKRAQGPQEAETAIDTARVCAQLWHGRRVTRLSRGSYSFYFLGSAKEKDSDGMCSGQSVEVGKSGKLINCLHGVSPLLPHSFHTTPRGAVRAEGKGPADPRGGPCLAVPAAIEIWKVGPPARETAARGFRVRRLLPSHFRRVLCLVSSQISGPSSCF